MQYPEEEKKSQNTEHSPAEGEFLNEKISSNADRSLEERKSRKEVKPDAEQVFDRNHTPISIEGARVHNLKDISLEIPRNRLTVITGPSGSGKSSLAFDTIYAEGQRQYIESLSVYSRQFLHQLERPDVDLIRGLQPTISIDQRGYMSNPRSTVATITEIYDFLRILYSRIGLAHCYQCGRPIRQQTPEQILEEIMHLPENVRIMILAPVVRSRKGQHKELLRQLLKAGFVRARVDGTLVEIAGIPDLDPQKYHNIEVVVDRLVLKDGIRPRLSESIKLAIKHGEGLVGCIYEKERFTTPEGTTRSIWKDLLFSTLYSCPKCKINYLELEPRTFSFNSPYGVCPVCQGAGKVVDFDPDLLVPQMSLSLKEGAVPLLKGLSVASRKKMDAAIEKFLNDEGIAADLPLDQWTEKQRSDFFYGDCTAAENAFSLLVGNADAVNPPQENKGIFAGIIPLIAEMDKHTKLKKEKELFASCRDEIVCRACKGSRIRPESRTVSIADKKIYEITALTVVDALDWFRNLELVPEQRAIANPLIEQIIERLDFMNRVGLDYLTLDRPSDSLSGGELQRVRLATGLGSGLVGVCYILDEPSTGLHPRDNQRLIDAMRNLQHRGNTVLVVEHDEAIIRNADWLIDIGPGAGVQGGEILAEGIPEAIASDPRSITGRYLAGKESIPLPKKRRRINRTKMLTIEGVSTNNLQDVSVSFPLGTFICVSGVSGSGKSSLLNETLVPAVARRLYGSNVKAGPCKSLRGVSRIDKLIQIDQTPIGRSPRSNPATYTGLFDEIRKVFASSRDARRLGYKAGRFSFNVAGGRCEECQGQGVRKIEMHFLPDLYATCPVCQGKRFNRQTLEIKYKNKSIADVLDMSIDEAFEFFENHQTILRSLESLRKVGLGYLTLGQSSTTLSGGEAQRIKLAAELARVETGNTLYVLDEPTCGLHVNDVRQLLIVLSDLVDLGNTVIVIEHNLDVLKIADWIIDLGPEGGKDGGKITACGTPEEVAALEENYTGRFLREYLRRG
ncbi:MAG: excinuclease ABC subunit UvrA [Planctomycetia bacterium]|nr:excinuclease ABC subunit UvrA [Planctomycetia bacterium]